MSWDIPSNENVQGVTCVKAVIPDNPAWRRFVLDFFYHLTRGRSWYRESGVIVDVQEIARAILDTVEFGDCGEGDCSCDGVEQTVNQLSTEIQQLRQELEEMQINIYNGGCGCNGTQTNSTTPTTTTPTVDSPYDLCLPPLPEGENQTDPNFDSWKCDSSHHLIIGLIQATTNMYQLVSAGQSGISDVLGAWSSVFTGVFAIVDLAIGTFNYIVSYFLNILSEPTYQSILLWLNQNRDDLAKALYCASSPVDAYNAMKDLVDSSSLPLATKFGLKVWFMVLPYATLFLPENERGSVPSYGQSCSCGDDIPTDFDFDVTFDTKENATYDEFWDGTATRFTQGVDYYTLKARDDFANVWAGFSRNGVLQVVSDALGVALADIQSVNIRLMGGWVDSWWDNGGTCSQGLETSHRDFIGARNVGGVIPVPCGVYGEFTELLDVTIDGNAGTEPIVGYWQSYIEGSQSGLSSFRFNKFRIAGYAVVGSSSK